MCLFVCVCARVCAGACNANKLPLFGGVFIPESPRTTVNTRERPTCLAHLAGHSVAHAQCMHHYSTCTAYTVRAAHSVVVRITTGTQVQGLPNLNSTTIIRAAPGWAMLLE